VVFLLGCWWGWELISCCERQQWQVQTHSETGNGGEGAVGQHCYKPKKIGSTAREGHNNSIEKAAYQDMGGKKTVSTPDVTGGSTPQLLQGEEEGASVSGHHTQQGLEIRKDRWGMASL